LPSRRPVLAGIGWLTVCIAALLPAQSGAGETAATGDFQQRWNSYVAALHPQELQPDCRPRLFEPAEGLAYRGTVVLIHGYTACPQEFFALSRALARQGYRVILPLLPGHGRRYPALKGDDLSGLPVSRDWAEAYGELVSRINGIMEVADGDRVIGGLSVGASTSLYAYLRDPLLYDRMILFSPFFAVVGGGLFNSLLSAGANIPGLRELSVKPFGFRKGCLRHRTQGRAGICNYRLKHVGAIEALARYNRAHLKRSAMRLPVQVVGTLGDSVVSNAYTRSFVSSQVVLQSARGRHSISACFLDRGVPHSMWSPFDNAGIEMYWLDSLLAGSVRFIVSGEPFPQEPAGRAGSRECLVGN